MIRIRLINEGKVVKQITSRVHEGVVMEQISQYAEAYDTVQIVEGDLSEDAKSMLQRVAKKIVPAAMAAGMAMSGAQTAQAQGGANPNYPGLNRSVGQTIGDIVNPRYKEMQRQREHQRSTERQVWDAEQNEIRRQRVSAARTGAGGQPPGGAHQTIYDQSRISQDGKSYLIYGMDNRVRRIPVSGTEYMPADSQRLSHYITPSGNVYYVRHPHMNESITEGVAESVPMQDAVKVLRQYGADHFKTTSNELHFYKNGQPFSVELISNSDATRSVSLSQLNSAGRKLKGQGVAEGKETPESEVERLKLRQNAEHGKASLQRQAATQARIRELENQIKDKSDVAEGYTVTRGIDRERYTERPGLEGPFSTRSGKVVYYDKAEGKYYDPETDFYIGHEDYAKMDEGWKDKVAAGALAATMALGAGAAHARVSGDHDPSINRLTGKPVATQVASGDQKPAVQAPKSFSKEYLQSVVDGKHPRPMISVEKAQQLLQQMGESKQGVAEGDPNATVGTISSTGTTGTSGTMSQRTQFAPTGKTTNARFNKNGQIELDADQDSDGGVKLDADAVKQLQQAGVKMNENQDSPVAAAIARRIMSQRLDLLKDHGPALVTQAIDQVAEYVGDVEEIGSSDVSGWVKHVEQMLRDNPPEAFSEAVNEGADTLDGILSKFSADYAKFRAGGDIDENQDFFDALYEYYFDQMPYGVQKARTGDPYEWITQQLDQEGGIAPVAEADEDTADQNIIMQIRKASDYERPTRIELADGTESIIAPNIAKQLLAKFDKMKPDSKALLQNTLNTEAGFAEILDYFGGGVREQAAARAGNIMQSAMAEAGYYGRDRRDSYQRDLDHSTAGFGRNSYAYSQDGGANDEDHSRDEEFAAQYAKKQEYERTGKFWLKQKDTQQHISDNVYVGKAAANAAALELLKQQPELKGNLVITAYGPLGEAAPAGVKIAAGAAMGALSGAGGHILGAVFGPIGSVAMAASMGYQGAKMGMNAADKIWDFFSSKLGSDDRAEQFAMSHLTAANQGQSTFDFEGKTYQVQVPQQQARAAAVEVRKVTEALSEAFGSSSVDMTAAAGTDGHQQSIDFYNQEVDNLAGQADPEFQEWIEAAEEKLVAAVRAGKPFTHLAKVLSAQQVKKFGGKTLGQRYGSQMAGKADAFYTSEIRDIIAGPVTNAGNEMTRRHELSLQLQTIRSGWRRMSPEDKQNLADQVGYSIEELEQFVKTGQHPDEEDNLREMSSLGNQSVKQVRPATPDELRTGYTASRSHAVGADGNVYYFMDPKLKQVGLLRNKQQGVAEAGYPDVDHMPGPTIKRTQTGCKRCHGKGYVYKTPDGEVHPMNRPDAKKYKCGKCSGIGFVKVAEAGNKPLEKSRFGTGDTRTPRDIKSQMSGASDEFVKSTADKNTGPFHSKVAKMQGKMAKSELRRREQGVAEGDVDEASLAQMRDYFAQPESDSIQVNRNYSAPSRKQNPEGIPPEIQTLVNKMYHAGKISSKEFEILKQFQQKTKINVGIREADTNPYAIGMSQAMKSTGDKPPLKKSTINKAHKIARAIEKGE